MRPIPPALALGALLAGCAPPSLQASYRDDLQVLAAAGPVEVVDPDAPVALDGEVLDRDATVRAVLARNPDLVAARAAWRAALAAFPQVTAWQDPELMVELAPGSLASPHTHPGVMVELGQRLPFPGRLAARGRAALARAAAVEADLAETRLELALAAARTFDDLWLVHRALEVNAEQRRLVQEVYEGGVAGVRAGRGTLVDPLQAQVELARLEREAGELEADRSVLGARLNGLLHRPPGAPLPPPAPLGGLPLPGEGAPVRPAVVAADAAVDAAEAELQEARLSFAPDVTLMGRFDSMWELPAHQWMVGVGLMLPVQVGARRGQVAEARARLAQASAERAAVRQEVAVEVEAARRRLDEALRTLRVLEERLLPAADEALEAARAAYRAGSVGYPEVIEATRAVREARLAHAEALATAHSRVAELERNLGGLPASPVVEAQ